MNLLKSLFASAYITSGVAGVIYSLMMILHGANVLAWGGVLLTICPFQMTVGRIFWSQNIARTSARFPLISVLATIGVGLSLTALAGDEPNPAAPVIATGLWLGFLLYAYWYSSFGGRQPSKKISIGQRLPSFSVLSRKGERIDSLALASKPAILIFYRGNWCPLCVAQINELVGLYRQISALGVRVALISSQPHERTVALSKKFDVDFDFLTDEGNAAARALGIENPHGLPMGMQVLGYDSDTVMPTVIITDRQGKVIWADETDNYRVRPEPSVYLEVLESNGIGLIAS